VRPADLASALGYALILAVVGSASAQGAPAPLLAAHRGGAALWPENSLLAFRNAVALGADYLELDVHLSRDGEVVVIHDPTLDRTTTGTGPVVERTIAELRALRLKDRSHAVTAEAIPTLDEVVALAAAGGRRLLLEIKVDSGKARYPGIEERVLAILDRHGMAAATVVMAFEAETWRRVRALRPEVRAGALYSARALPSASAVSRALSEAGAAGVGFMGLAYSLVTPEAVAEARKAGIVLGAWTVNEPDVMRMLIDHGIGVLITDRPDVAKNLLTQRRSP
jgi:glycerophosphoryl diester phosphodiesterase